MGKTKPRLGRSAEIADRLRAEVLDGTFATGSFLPPERELAARFGAHRSSIREALAELATLGLVEIRRGSGARVRPLERASFGLVGTLLFAADGPDPAWTQDLLELADAVARGCLRAALARGEGAAVAVLLDRIARATESDLDEAAFSDALAALGVDLAIASGNRAAVMFTHQLSGWFRDARFDSRRAEVQKERRSLVGALRRLHVALGARDREAAERCLADLVRRLSTALVEPGPSPARSDGWPRRLTGSRAQDTNGS